MLFCHPDCIVEYVKSEVSHTYVNFKRNSAQEDLRLWQSLTKTETTFWVKKRTWYMQGCKQVNLCYPYVYEMAPVVSFCLREKTNCNMQEHGK